MRPPLLNITFACHFRRYFACIVCRMVAETVLRTTFMSMSTCDSLESAITHAIFSLTFNSIHLSMLPVLIERYIQRIIQYEPLLGMVTLGICLKVPVVSMKSILQLMNGERVTNEEDRLAMYNFVKGSINSNNMLLYVGMDGYSNQGGVACMPGYVTCNVLRVRYSDPAAGNNPGGFGGGPGFGYSSGGGGGGGGGGYSSGGRPGGGSNQQSSANNVSAQGVPLDPMYTMIRRLYRNNEKVLTSSAFLADLFGFQRCITSLMKTYDLRQFFGGMSAYHNSRAMAEALGIEEASMFVTDFVEGMSGKSDPIMMPARIPKGSAPPPAGVPLSSSVYAEADYCLALRVWDVLLWFAIMRRPRRDVGICADFANTLAECCMQLLPRSVFPFDKVPMTRLDPVDGSQVWQAFDVSCAWQVFWRVCLNKSVLHARRSSWRCSFRAASTGA